ncbi:MAG: TetR/AcrR family transcriptional regulator [Hydrogenophaga sp.]|jgi:AcrR family transcriptional regulator|uniref:TetR/AcrR family transcriptional regulator n=1 Tax=Hydrogenophaga sp. TaxID=1904254 RepID=UPI001DB84A8C|nr:TetR/AcrR family transcriptional regulator [Hydrogenophaga sp.]MBW0170094.1 TetR/AcrR family transcriptional regulator [Hydrogenophaga sp.]MBW0182502.1 TetR/AcrR family transcriptional regulator [Hydrogenophaga sp.]
MKPKDDDKQQAIARATLALVERVGLSGLTMAGIAREAGIATGTLYVYHRSKEELLNALYEQVKGALVGLIDVDIDAATPFRTRFQMNWTRLLRHRLAHGPEAVFMDQYYNSPWFSEASRQFSARFAAGCLRFFDEAREQQIVKDAPTMMLAAHFFGSVRDTASLLRSGDLPDTEAALAQAFGLCWDGIKA